MLLAQEFSNMMELDLGDSALKVTLKSVLGKIQVSTILLCCVLQICE
jgi:hypothetical protein